MAKIFDEAYSGRLKSWDTQWLYACLMSSGYCIIPRVNLVSNFSLSGTHSSGHNQNLPTHDLYGGEALTHPISVKVASGYDNSFYEKSFRPPPFSLKRYIISVLVKYEWAKKAYRIFKPKN